VCQLPLQTIVSAMKTRFVILMLLLALACAIACLSFFRRDRVRGHSADYLAPRDLELLQKQGATNASAAYRVHLHYTWADFDQKKSLFWQRQAATLGNAIAQYNLAHDLQRNGASLEEYRKWLSLAATQGMREAIEELRQIKSNPKQGHE
jgi:TPR repeat protein